jgi:Protein of unknown function (DUF3139)
MKKMIIVLLTLLIGGFLFYQYHVYSTKKEMENATIKYLEMHGENEDNIKEIENDFYVLKGYKYANVIFEDEPNFKYVFSYLNNRDGKSLRYESARKTDGDLHIREEQELKHQKLRKQERFYFDSE